VIAPIDRAVRKPGRSSGARLEAHDDLAECRLTWWDPVEALCCMHGLKVVVFTRVGMRCGVSRCFQVRPARRNILLNVLRTGGVEWEGCEAPRDKTPAEDVEFMIPRRLQDGDCQGLSAAPTRR